MRQIRRYCLTRSPQLCYADSQLLILHRLMQGVSYRITVTASVRVSEARIDLYVLASPVVILAILLIMVVPNSMDAIQVIANGTHTGVK